MDRRSDDTSGCSWPNPVREPRAEALPTGERGCVKRGLTQHADHMAFSVCPLRGAPIQVGLGVVRAVSTVGTRTAIEPNARLAVAALRWRGRALWVWVHADTHATT